MAATIQKGHLILSKRSTTKRTMSGDTRLLFMENFTILLVYSLTGLESVKQGSQERLFVNIKESD